MKTTRILSLFLAFALLLTALPGCGRKNTALDDLKPTDELVLCLPKEMERYITEQFIHAFNVLYEDVHVRTVVIPGDDYTYRDYAERVMNDLLAGEGPDVLFLEYLPDLDIEKAARNHNFYDLTGLLESDPAFHEEDYLDGVLDAVRIGGRLYTMPRSFFASNYLSSREKLEELDFDWGRIETTSDFMEELVRMTPIAARDESFSRLLETENRFFELFRASGIRLLDYGEGTVLPDEAAFRTFMDSYKAFFPYDYDASGEQWFSKTFSANYRAPDLMEGKSVFWAANTFYSLNLNMQAMMEAGYACTLGTLPAETGEVVGQINTQLAIRANSENVLNAWRFIRLLCSEEIMTETFWNHHSLMYSIGLREPIQEVPVLRRAIEAVVRGEGPLRGNHHLTDEERDGMIRQYSAIDRFTVRPNRAVFVMMWDAMLPWLQDEKSYEDCVSGLKSKLTFYLSE